MERSRPLLITLVCVLFSSISGAEVERQVGPGDDVTLYCDCIWETGFGIAWFKNSSHEHQPHLIMSDVNLMLSAFPRYSTVWNPSNKTLDLRLRNVTDSDLGLYYCAAHEKTDSEDQTGVKKDVYRYGKTTTRLSFHAAYVKLFQTPSTVQSTSTLQTHSTPPVSDCSVCWKLLVIVCPVCVLLSSVISSTCVYCICRSRAKADGTADRRGDDDGGGGGGGGGDVAYASLNIPNSGQRRLKKRAAESSDLCTYSEVTFERV